MTARELSEREIKSLVRDLESLRGGPTAAAALIGCGARAIAPLRQSLLEGPPRGIYQPRQLMVETLAELGAKEVLIEYLLGHPTIEDPVVRHAEDAVRSTAARELGRWQSDDVFECLRQVTLVQLLPGAVEALGLFRRTDVMPYFLWALGDDICRSPAEEAIRKLGEAAKPYLLQAVNSPSPSAEEETPSSLQRRRWALRILSDLQLAEADWPALQKLLNEEDPEIVITAARISLSTAPLPDKSLAVRRIIAMLPRADWFLRTEARAALAQHFEVAREPVEEEIARRTKSNAKAQALDVVLRMLVNLRSQVLESGVPRQ
jgi:hypothetical protein